MAATIAEDAQTLHRRAVALWGDDVTAMMMEAVPGSTFFDELRNALNRADVAGLDPLLVGADIRAVCLQKGFTLKALAERLEVPYAYAVALDCGWQRLTTRGLVTVASRLEVSSRPSSGTRRSDSGNGSGCTEPGA